MTSQAILAEGRWNVAPSQTKVTVSAKKLGFLTVDGTLEVSTGLIEIDSNNQVTAVEISASSDTYNSANKKRDIHIKDSDFLDAATYPSIVFRCSNVKPITNGYQAKGTVTVKDTTTNLVVEIRDVEFDSGHCTFRASSAFSRKAIGVTKFPSFVIGSTLSLDVEVKAKLTK